MKFKLSIDNYEEVSLKYGDVQIDIEVTNTRNNKEVAIEVASNLIRDMMYQMGKIGK